MTLAFWLLAPVMVLAAVAMVLARKAVHSALALALVMICLAVQYAALEAPFLFAVQIIVYTGAILMLFLFVVMLVGVDVSDSFVETLKGQRAAAGLLLVGLLVLLITAVGSATYGDPIGLAQANGARGGNVEGLAAMIFVRYVWIFEATAALLITAALGAMVLTHRERLRAKAGQKELAKARMRRYAEQGTHPGPLPTPGVFARHNSNDIPALLPDGTIAEESISPTLRTRGAILEPAELTAPIKARTAEIGDPARPGLPGSTEETADGGRLTDEERI